MQEKLQSYEIVTRARLASITFCGWLKDVEALATEADAITDFILYCKLCFRLFNCKEMLIIHLLVRNPNPIWVACW